MFILISRRRQLTVRVLIAAALATLFSGAQASAPSSEAADDGHALLRECSAAIAQLDGQIVSDADALLAQYCLGFVSGATRLVAITEPLKPGGQLFCPDANGISGDRALRAVHAYLLAHPERLHGTRITLVSAALAGEYPCPPADTQMHEQLLQYSSETD